MLKFEKLGKNVDIIKDYVENSRIKFCDVSLGVKYMWREDFIIDYAFFNDVLILKESCKDYQNAFYFPFFKSKNPSEKSIISALTEIERYCLTDNVPLIFCCIDNTTANFLTSRYPYATIYNLREWSDYIYDAETFKTYSGKKMSGQRNHVNKFKKTYPDYSFKILTQKDVEKINGFLEEFEQINEFSLSLAKTEEQKVRDFVNNSFNLNQVGGYIEINGKVVAFSIGERVNDTLIIHVEKALKNYEGVYPTMAQEFVKAFAVNGIKYINREEDCGDMGLRISKLQYHPIEIKEKNIVKIDSGINKIIPPVNLKTERLNITDINKEDAKNYRKLCLDEKLNKFWGYDYKEDLKENKPTKEYFFNFMNKLKTENEYSFGVKLNGTLIGELVLWHFDFLGGAEIGFRFFKEYQGFNYAFESATALTDFAFNTLKIKTLYAKCYKENSPSKNLIQKLKFNKEKEDEVYIYYKKVL